MSSTRISRRVNAPREAVYRALLDARAVAKWMVPDGMTSQVHAFDPREGGSFRARPARPARLVVSGGFGQYFRPRPMVGPAWSEIPIKS